MQNRKLPLISLIISVLISLIVSAIASYAGDDLSIRAQKRNLVPAEKMMQTLNSPKREAIMQPERVLDLFKVRQGETVADIGAGTGFFSFRLAARVGAAGKVYAVEIEEKILDYLGKKMEEEKVTNISLIKSTETSPNLPPGSCDKIMVVNSYYYFHAIPEFMRDLRMALKPGGSFLLIDLDKDKVSKNEKVKDTIYDIKPRSTVIEEMKTAGFVLRESYDFFTHRFFMIFEPDDQFNR